MKDKPKLKRTIAKEILILFFSAIAIGLVWTFFLGVNIFNTNKAERLEEQITTLTYEIDSLYAIREKCLVDILLINNLPKECFDDSGRLPLILTFLSTTDSSERSANIYRLHKLLTDLKFSFFKDGLTPDLPTFNTNIEKELQADTLKHLQLKEIYFYLKEKNYIDVSYKDFYFTLDYYKLLPTQDEIDFPTTRRFELIREQQNIKIYTRDDFNNILKWLTIITLILIYPIRILILLLKWSFDIVRQKQE